MADIKKCAFLLLILCIGLIAPVTAGTKYMAGSPELSAYISGTNQFEAGDTVQLAIVIQNTGLNEFKFVDSGIVDRADLPNTAKFLTAAIQPSYAPIIIKSDAQMLGDLDGGSTVNAVFSTKINSDAAAGIYNIPLWLNYTYLYTADQYGEDTIRYTYKTENVTVNVPINITPDVSVAVLSATPEDLNVGTEGYINMTIKNTGYEDGSKSIVRILQNGQSPIVPIDSSVYIGDFPAGSVVNCTYKVAVTSDAQKQTYPVDVVVVYQNTEGDYVTSRSDTFGIPVGSKVDFDVISPPSVLNPGEKNAIKVEFKNTGDATVYSAQALISAVDPFTSDDDIAFLGDLSPGQSATASYIVSVDRTANIKEYGLDSQIQYRDALDNAYTSDTMKVTVDVTQPAGVNAIVSNPIYLVIIIAAIIVIVYLVNRYRKKNK